MGQLDTYRTLRFQPSGWKQQYESQAAHITYTNKLYDMKFSALCMCDAIAHLMLNLISLGRTGLPCSVILFWINNQASLQQKNKLCRSLMSFTIHAKPGKHWSASFSGSAPSEFHPPVLQHSGGTPVYPWGSHSCILPGFATYWCKCVTFVILSPLNRSQWSFVVKKIYIIFNGTFTKIQRGIKLRSRSSFKNVFGSNKAKRSQ